MKSVKDKNINLNNYFTTLSFIFKVILYCTIIKPINDGVYSPRLNYQGLRRGEDGKSSKFLVSMKSHWNKIKPME